MQEGLFIGHLLCALQSAAVGACPAAWAVLKVSPCVTDMPHGVSTRRRLIMVCDVAVAFATGSQVLRVQSDPIGGIAVLLSQQQQCGLSSEMSAAAAACCAGESAGAESEICSFMCSTIPDGMVRQQLHFFSRVLACV
jgi:hypothetical protein